MSLNWNLSHLSLDQTRWPVFKFHFILPQGFVLKHVFHEITFRGPWMTVKDHVFREIVLDIPNTCYFILSNDRTTYLLCSIELFMDETLCEPSLLWNRLLFTRNLRLGNVFSTNWVEQEHICLFPPSSWSHYYRFQTLQKMFFMSFYFHRSWAYYIWHTWLEWLTTALHISICLVVTSMTNFVCFEKHGENMPKPKLLTFQKSDFIDQGTWILIQGHPENLSKPSKAVSLSPDERQSRASFYSFKIQTLSLCPLILSSSYQLKFEIVNQTFERVPSTPSDPCLWREIARWRSKKNPPRH